MKGGILQLAAVGVALGAIAAMTMNVWVPIIRAFDALIH